MNPYYMQMMQQAGQQPQHGMPLQNIPQQPVIRPTVIPYNVETAEQMSAIIPMPNTIYLGINDKDGKIFITLYGTKYQIVIEEPVKTTKKEK